MKYKSMKQVIITSSDCHWIFCSSFQMGKKFYAVAMGRQVGVFTSWPECQAQIKGFPKARFKGFHTEHEALDFIQLNSSSTTASQPSQSLRRGLDDPFQLCDVIKQVGAFGSECLQLSEQTPLDEVRALVLKGLDFFNQLKVSLLDRTTPSSAEASDNEPPKKKPKIQHKPDHGNDDEDGHEIDDRNFIVSKKDGAVQVYTDGACNKNGTVMAKAGYGVWFNDNHPENISKPLDRSQKATNNVAEMQAIIEAIRSARRLGIAKLCIHSDSQYTIKAVTQWIYRWKTNNWTTLKGSPVENQTEMKILDELIHSEGCEVTFKYVHGHAGVKGNEEADRLARAGASR